MNIMNIRSQASLKNTIAHFRLRAANFFKNEDGTTDVYTVDKCDYCKTVCRAPNGVKFMKETKQEWFGQIGMTEDKVMLDEISANDDGDAVCENCYNEPSDEVTVTVVIPFKADHYQFTFKTGKDEDALWIRRVYIGKDMNAIHTKAKARALREYPESYGHVTHSPQC